MLDTFDRDGNFLGVKSRSFCHNGNPQCFHKTVGIWVINDRGEILVQKRAARKAQFPNKWDTSCGGHVSAGDSELQTCVKEIGEELGMQTQPADFHFLTKWFNPAHWDFIYLYYLRTNLTAADFVLQTEEVADVKYVPYDEFVKLFYSKDFSAHAPRELKDWVCAQLRTLING